MNKFRQSLEKFLQGRYGIDELNKILFAVYLILFILNLLTGDSLFYILGVMVVIYVLFRCMSKNLTARRMENEKFTSIAGRYSRKKNLYKRMWKDRHTHVYRKCPHCHTTIRLPKVKGRHTTNCPKCHKDFDVKV